MIINKTTMPAAANKELRAFLITVIVVCILFIFLFAYNAYTYNRIRNNLTETTPVARAEANALFWLNIIWIIVVLAILVWAAYEATAIKKVLPAIPTYTYVQKPTVATTPVVVAQTPVQIARAPVEVARVPLEISRQPNISPIPLYSVKEPFTDSEVCSIRRT